jgi:hypothetical protein
MQPEQYEFVAVATSVEERFRRVYNTDKLRDAKVESQMEYDQISTGWWLVIPEMGISLRIGDQRPTIDAGDVLSIIIGKR